MNMDDKTSTGLLTIEIYALYNNVGVSILKLNPIIEKFGYKFISVNLADFEKNFSNLVSLPKDFQSRGTVLIEDGKYAISGELYDLISKHQSFGHMTFMKNEVVFLKRIENYEQEIVNNNVDFSLAMNVYSEMYNFNRSLIQYLRLYKTGDIASSLEFQINADTRHITLTVGGPTKVVGHIEFILTDADVNILRESLLLNFSSTPLTELAISNFNLSYEIADLKTKYITLITCLESLINLGSHQITHTVSRHLSLIISNSIEEFQLNYVRTKQLYGIRSSIVHGGEIKEDLSKVTNELQDKVRKAINYCLKLSLNKNGLFEKFNAMGYGLTDTADS